MKTLLSILRGINVSGQKKIRMAELKTLYEELGLKNITTYIQSGNVIFEDKNPAPAELVKQIEQKIFDTYQFKVPVIIRTVGEIQHVLNNNPFLQKGNAAPDAKALHVTFLAEAPEPEHIDRIKDFSADPDEFVISGREIYLFCPSGYGRTKLTNTFFENKLKVTATTRNWRTLNELLRLMKTEPL